MPLKLQTLLPMACDGKGVSQTCISLLRGMQAHGIASQLFANRARARPTDLNHRLTLPQAVSWIPYRYAGKPATWVTERHYLACLRDGAPAYLWPAASLAAHHEVKRRGNPIILEGINTRMLSARTILDEAYQAEGLTPSHPITQQRIDEEEEKLALADYFFAPSPLVEQALEGTELQRRGRILSSSYGSDRMAAEPVSQDSDEPVFLFVGLSGIRKGLHTLLRAWEKAGIRGRLQLCGAIEPVVQQLCAAQLARPDVEYRGFVRDMEPIYRNAHVFVFPSLEEGDPLVTHEAAAHGLPVIATSAGMGRLRDHAPGARLVPPLDVDALSTALQDFAGSRELRTEVGRECWLAARHFTWDAVGAERAATLRSLFPN